MFSTSAMSNCFLCWTFISSFNAVFTAAQSKSFIVKSMFAYVLSNLLDPFYFFSFVFFFFFLFSFYCFIHAILFSLIGFMSVLLLSQFIRVAQRYLQLAFLPSVVYSDRTKETKNSQRMECLFNYTYIPLVLIGIHSMNRIIKIHISTHNSILKNFVFG